MNYYLLKENINQDKYKEYIIQKKKLANKLRNDGWNDLAGKLLGESSEYIANKERNNYDELSIMIQLDEISITKYDRKILESKFK